MQEHGVGRTKTSKTLEADSQIENDAGSGNVLYRLFVSCRIQPFADATTNNLNPTTLASAPASTLPFYSLTNHFQHKIYDDVGL